METRMQRADIQAPSTPEQYRAALDRQERVIAELRKNLDHEKTAGKSDAVQSFVNSMIGAYEAGFVDSNTLTLATIYQVMRNHCKDEFGVEVEDLDAAWGEDTARGCDK